LSGRPPTEWTDTVPVADAPEPTVRVFPQAGPTTAVVLVLHGGKARSTEPTTLGQLSYRRMVPIAAALHRAVGPRGAAVWLLRNRLRGWNTSDGDPVADARWALARVGVEHPDVPVVVVGHSMGARAALRVAGEPSVIGVCALAPWIEPGEPVEQLAGRTVVIAHGTRDRWTSPARSFRYAVRARAVARRLGRFEVGGAGHAMLRRSGDWTSLVTSFVSGLLDPAAEHPAIAEVLNTPGPEGLRLPLPGGAW
jgi:alpha-beta hydrolase superfamily lysophospholipase